MKMVGSESRRLEEGTLKLSSDSYALLSKPSPRWHEQLMRRSALRGAAESKLRRQ